ncbi:MAG: GHKL domain-containing protein [Gammaproteobacteria bacterium]|nr:GHKL domain-containing protein [Gammaproteobacteria bacterium]
MALPLALFCGVMMWVLDSGFRELSARSLRGVLDAEMVSLIAAADPQPDGGYAPSPQSLDPRLARPRSGLYAAIRSDGPEWRSPSTAGRRVNFGPALRGGERRYSYDSFGHDRVAIENRAIEFVDSATGTARALTFSIAVSLSPYEEQLWSFRRALVGWFLGLMLLLLVTLAALLQWVLAPLRRLQREIHEVEEGRSTQLGVGYPREIAGVAGNLNTLLGSERRRVSRYRDTLGNLAHSLKTPLAVMRASLTAADSGPVLAAEIERMNGIIEHQLKRAAASGGGLLGQAPVEVGPLAVELRLALLKVYAGKDLSIELAVVGAASFTGDRSDLLELLGNLLDNACKWCRSRVLLSATIQTAAPPRQRLELTVEDDGPGISDADRERVLERGVRTDEKVPGHGLGLAMVRETVELYGGQLTLETSQLGGLCARVRLPGR